MAVAPRQCFRSHDPICQAVSDQQRNNTVMGHPPYSPDLAPLDFFLKNLAKREPILPLLMRFKQKWKNS
ncbi:hypothetical protein TNCV_2374581 [Trichonephila clavipes]|nr:hypothetical protein TNCV_2374581 [Trichonephila clavipes]